MKSFTLTERNLQYGPQFIRGWDIIRDRRLKRDYLAALKSRIMRHDPDQARELSDEQIIIERELELLDRFVHSAKGSARAATWNEYVKEFPKSFL